MNSRTKLGTMVGATVLAALTAVACAAPVEDDATLPDVEGSVALQQYTVPTTEPTPTPKAPTCCLPSTSCCKEWCVYHREKCGTATSCWSDKVACDRRCDNSHG